ncbi:AMP-binding protein [Rhodococcus pyridinivorans]|nr:AMP-binding protein [Rhodococcus pyridinivorans]
MSSAPVVRCGPDERTHLEVKDRSARLATALAEMGVRHGDRYAIVMRNEIAFLEATLAGAANGAVPVPVNWHWTCEDLAHLLIDSTSKVVIVHTDLLSAVEAILPEGVRIIEAPVPQHVADEYGFARPDPTGRHLELEALIANSEPVATAITDPPLSIIYTSGTTGRPKGILRQPVAPETASTMAELVMTGLALEPSMSTLIPAPLYHTAPNVHATFAVALGMDLEIMARFDAEKLLALVDDRRINHVQMVPTMFVRLLRLAPEIRSRYDLSSLMSVVHAAAPCPREIKQKVIDWLGPIVHEFYGGSETAMVVACTSAQWLAHPGTVGRPIGDAAVTIVGDDGAELPPGEVGEIYLKPFSAWPDFTYLGNEAKRRDMERDGFVTIGDIGYVDAEGYVFLEDRRNDMIISGGVNIYPAEIEACIVELDTVADVAVFGVLHPEFGETIAAHVEPVPGSTVEPAAIRAHVAGRLAKYKVPSIVIVEKELPREDSGKLFKRKLREPYWKDPVDA